MVVVSSESATAGDPGFRAVVRDVSATLAAEPRVTEVVPPREGFSISRGPPDRGDPGGRRRATPNEMVRVADDLKDPLAAGRDRRGRGAT